MTISGKWCVVIVVFIFLYQTAWAENYFSKLKACPRGSGQKVELIAEVDPQLLPQYQPNQGDSSSCGIHAAMVLANAIYKLEELRKGTPSKQDLSFLDGMLRFGRNQPEEEDDCSLPFMDSPTSFLLKLRNQPKLFLDSTPLTITTAIAGNDALLAQIEHCKTTQCNQKRMKGSKPHPDCLLKISKRNYLKQLSNEISDWNQVAKTLDPQFPIQTILRHSRPLEVIIPEFQLKTWDLFATQSELLEDIIDQFIGQETILPLALGTRVDSDDDVGHAVILNRIEKVECVDASGSIKRTGYQATLLNSWGRGREKNGPFDLEVLVKGMALEGQGFTQILPCNPTTQDCSKAIIEHSKSVPLIHYAEANDPEQVRSHLLRRDCKPNLAIASGMTPLIQASVDGYPLVVKALLERPDTDPNRPLPDGATALYFAAQEGHLEIVRALMERPEIDPNLAWQGKTPLYAAALFQKTEVIQELLKSPKVIRTPHSDFLKYMEDDPQIQEGYREAPHLIEEIRSAMEESTSPKRKKQRFHEP
jgi:hypothetical protein